MPSGFCHEACSGNLRAISWSQVSLTLAGSPKILRLPIILILLAAHRAFAIEVIAHRGYTCDAVENSVPSIRRAWRAGADAVEIDIRVSGDGVVYLFHDEEILGRKITDLPYSEIVALSDTRIYTLAEVMEIPDAEGYFVLDLKTRRLADLDKVVAVVRASHIPSQKVSFQSESIDALEHIQLVMPDAKSTFLSSLKWKIPYLVQPDARQLVRKLNGRKIHRVSIKGRSFIDRKFIDTIKASGREVHVWTINDPVRAMHYKEIGVDGLITDRVEELFGSARQAGECRMAVTAAS